MTSRTDPLNAAPTPQAAVVLACSDLAANLQFFVEELGFRLERISPADDPSVATVVGRGLRLRLERSAEDVPARLRIDGEDGSGTSGRSTAPNGTRIEFGSNEEREPLPPLSPEPVLTVADEVGWQAGRAGMRYRDLIPGRLGGRCIASRIRIEEGGPVPDYVHHHAVLFQLIYCAEGWVRVVYQDQGEPFVLNAGDCVLQPPGIRHRVLESSAGLEVVELASPARHDTFADHALDLPNTKRVGRSYGGQRFVHHVADEATWEPGPSSVRTRDLGLAPATEGLVRALVHVIPSDTSTVRLGDLGRNDRSAYRFLHVLSGEGRVSDVRSTPIELRRGDSLTLPGAIDGSWSAVQDAELLYVEVQNAPDVTA